MDEKETVGLIQKYRHDLMNRLQIVSGYLSMGKADKAKKNLDDVIKFYEEERKLMRLNADAFMIWVLRFQDNYPSFALTYRIDLLESMEKSIDGQKLLSACEALLAVLSDAAEAFHVHELFLHMKEKETHWEIGMNINNVVLEKINMNNVEKQYGISMTNEKEQTSFNWKIAKEERGE